MRKLFFLLLVCTSLSIDAQVYESGIASYYGDYLHGRNTASGQPYDKTKFTCAHKKLPFGTMLKVTRVDNNKSVIVRVNDRGPFKPGRIVDLSRAAANKIGLDGLTSVNISLMDKKAAPERPDTQPLAKKETKKKAIPQAFEFTEKGGKPKFPTVNEKPKKDNTSVVTTKKATPQKKMVSLRSLLVKEPAAKPVVPKGVPQNFEATEPAPPAVSLEEDVQTEKGGEVLKKIRIQLAVFSSLENAEKMRSKLEQRGLKQIEVETLEKQNRYKVLMGRFDKENDARTILTVLKRDHGVDGFIVK